MTMPVTKRSLAGLSGVMALVCAMAIAANASENAIFECTSGASQICYFNILRQPGGTQTFAVQGHQRIAMAGLAPGRDWYLVAVDHAAPASMAACQNANFRCKAAIVQRGTNR